MKKLKLRTENKNLKYALELAHENSERLFIKNERLAKNLKSLSFENELLEAENERLRTELVKSRQESRTYRKQCEVLKNCKVSVLCVTEQKK